MKVEIPVVTPEKKQHLKQLVETFFADKKHFQLQNSISHGYAMATAIAAAHGAIDFSVFMEYFDDLPDAVLYFSGEKQEALDWRDIIISSTAYYFFDRPFLKCHDKLGDKIEGLYFQGEHEIGTCRPRESHKGSYLPKAELPDELHDCIAQNHAETLIKRLGSMSNDSEYITKTAYALLEAANWELFAALSSQFELLPLLDMEKVFDFWCKKIVWETVNGKKARMAFLQQLKEPRQYPLHRLILDWDQTGRVVPVFFEMGLLVPDVMELLFQREHSFDKPLAPYYGWEALTFRAFAEAYGCLAKYMPKRPPNFRGGCSDAEMLVNLQAAAQFNEYMLQHPQYGRKANAALIVEPLTSPKKKGLTEAQKICIANDEHRGIVFGNNYRMLKHFAQFDEAETYEVPDMVTAIGVEAFSGCEKLQQVILPAGLTHIGRDAFAFMKISRIDLPESLVSIGENAFVCCHELEAIRIPDGVKELPFHSFAYCEKLQTVELPQGIRINENAFDNSPNVKIVYRPVKNARQGVKHKK